MTDTVVEDAYHRPVRCLFTSKTGSLGHLLPLLPIAEAARASGNEVAIATSIDRRPDVEAAGFTFFPAGLALGEVGPRFRLVKARLVDQGLELHPRLGWDLEHTYAQMFTTVHGPVMAADLVAVMDRFRPDVVVCDLGEFGGPVAAAMAGVPCASHGFGLPIPESVAREAARWAAPMWEERGLSAPDDAAALLDVAVAGLVGLDVNVVVTVGRDGDPARFQGAGPNVSVHHFVPQDDLLPSCSLVVCHGGSGTVLGALGHGVPVVLLPHMADHFRNADAIRRGGCGVALDERDQTSPGIAAAARAVLDDRSMAVATEAVRTEMTAMPTPADVVERLCSTARVRASDPPGPQSGR